MQLIKIALVKEFYSKPHTITSVSCIVLYTAVGIGAIIGIIFMLRTHGCKNYTLAILLSFILTFSIILILIYSFVLTQNLEGLTIVEPIDDFLQCVIHWVLTQQYIKARFETKQLLNIRDLGFNLMQTYDVDRFKKNMKMLNTFVVIFSLIIALCDWVGWQYNNNFAYNVG